MITQQVLPEQATVAEKKNEAEWPRAYRVQKQLRHGYWSHKWYRGPTNIAVKVDYCETKEQSEKIAKLFLQEKVLGFDMEWPVFFGKHNYVLQDRIAMVQVASEDRIALFHIARHKGTTSSDLIAPSLRKLIESEAIIKTGHNIMSADCSRLHKYFGLKPRAIFELCHIHYLITHGPKDASKVTTSPRNISLAGMVQWHLDGQMSKDDEVRMCNWKSPLNSDTDPKQIARRTYAAADAYAGVMLYHRMNARRLAMKPSPPMPLLADEYLPFVGAKHGQVRLQSEKKGEEFTTALEFFKLEDSEDEDEDNDDNGEMKPKKEARKSKAKEKKEQLDPIAQELYERLVQRRKTLAVEHQAYKIYNVALNAELRNLAQEQPTDMEGLLMIKGLGKKKQEKYGADWLEVIRKFQEDKSLELAHIPLPKTPPPPMTPNRSSRRRKAESGTLGDSPESSPSAFGTPIQRTPQLHTGLSFTLAGTTLESQGIMTMDVEDASDEDAAAFCTPLSRPSSDLKRKRSQSPRREGNHLPIAEQPPTYTTKERIFRSKLQALSNRASAKLKWPPNSVVSSATLDMLVWTPPRTQEELIEIPGAVRFVEACRLADMDLLKNIINWSRPLSTDPS